MKRIISGMTMFALMLGVTACAMPVPQSSAEATEIFTDDMGRRVALPAEISRIVPTGPVAQIMLYALVPEMLVGLAAEWSASSEGIIPAEYRNLPYFGQLYNTANLNLEQLALADPQVIIDIGQNVSTGNQDLEILQSQTNIPAICISTSLEEMPRTFRILGKLLDREEKAEQLARFCESIYARTTHILEQVGENKINAIYVLGEQGLNVLAKDSYQAELLDLLTNNIAVVKNPSGKGSGNEVTMEQIALWDPDFILFAADSIYDTAADLEVWSGMRAIVAGNYLRVPDTPHNWLGSPPACQRYLGMIWLTARLYPEYCDYDVEKEIREFYEVFYHCRLTDGQYAMMTE